MEFSMSVQINKLELPVCIDLDTTEGTCTERSELQQNIHIV